MPLRTFKDAPPVPPVVAELIFWLCLRHAAQTDPLYLGLPRKRICLRKRICWPLPRKSICLPSIGAGQHLKTISALPALLPVRVAHRSSCTYHPSLEPFGRHQLTQFLPLSPSSRKRLKFEGRLPSNDKSQDHKGRIPSNDKSQDHKARYECG